MVAVDPGIHWCGVSIWEKARLRCALLVKHDSGEAGCHAAIPMAHAIRDVLTQVGLLPHTLVVEMPQVYVRERSKGDPNDLVDLAAVAGAVMYAVGAQDVVIYKPAEWKGQVPKDITHARALAKLNSLEQQTILTCRPAGLMHNVLDAVALGLAHLKKTGARP